MSYKKRYLITFKHAGISINEANSILGVENEKLFEGVSFMASNQTPGDNHVLHFEHVGVSSAPMSEDQVADMRNNPAVMAVEEDLPMFILGFMAGEQALSEALSEGSIQWNMDLVKASAAWERGIDGRGIKLAILDTGINIGHPDLAIKGGVSFVDGVSSYNDDNGHGTHCAGIACGKGVRVYGVAKGASLYAVKVLANTGSGQTSWIIAGMEWCITNGINIASMSLGGASGPSTAYNTAVQRCQKAGVTVICASGNSYQGAFQWVNSPANSFALGENDESPIAVGAIDKNSVIAAFSSRGGQVADWNQVTVVGPGVDIYSSYLDNGYIMMSGTSMACPHVAGLAALLYQRYPGISPQMVMKKMEATAMNLGTPSPNVAYGYGLIDCDAATR